MHCWSGLESMRSTSLQVYRSKPCCIVLKPHQDRIDYTVVCFVEGLQPKYVKAVQVQAECGLRSKNEVNALSIIGPTERECHSDGAILLLLLRR